MKSAIFSIICIISLMISQGNANCSPRAPRCRRPQGYGPPKDICKPDRRINNDISACAGPINNGLTGNSGNNLCGAGFEVCPSATRAAALGLTSGTCNSIGPGDAFWATRETSWGYLKCYSRHGGHGKDLDKKDGADQNDIFGCTTSRAWDSRLYKNAPCSPLVNALGNLRWNGVRTWYGWSQRPGGSGYNELQTIQHNGMNGGVLCCRRGGGGGYYAAAQADDEQVDDEESIIYDQQPFDVDYKPLTPQTNDIINLTMLVAALAVIILAVSATTYICISICNSNKNMANIKTVEVYE